MIHRYSGIVNSALWKTSLQVTDAALASHPDFQIRQTRASTIHNPRPLCNCNKTTLRKDSCPVLRLLRHCLPHAPLPVPPVLLRQECLARNIFSRMKNIRAVACKGDFSFTVFPVFFLVFIYLSVNFFIGFQREFSYECFSYFLILLLLLHLPHPLFLLLLLLLLLPLLFFCKLSFHIFSLFFFFLFIALNSIVLLIFRLLSRILVILLISLVSIYMQKIPIYHGMYIYWQFLSCEKMKIRKKLMCSKNTVI